MPADVDLAVVAVLHLLERFEMTSRSAAEARDPNRPHALQHLACQLCRRQREVQSPTSSASSRQVEASVVQLEQFTL